jgi:hypothetical protein
MEIHKYEIHRLESIKKKKTAWLEINLQMHSRKN